jgi:hypothetical protein
MNREESMEQPTPELEPERRRYEAPAVLYEAPLEVRAGTPLSPRQDSLVDPLADPLDPAGLWRPRKRKW